jgi:cell division septation protein DedD
MKTCPYCGAEYPDGTPCCTIDETPLSPPPAASRPVTNPASNPSPRAEFEIPPLTEEQRQMDLVTLVRCGSLISADLIASRLRAAGIETFIPDQSLVQTMGYNLNVVGYVRVQVSPADYDRARDIISG